MNIEVLPQRLSVCQVETLPPVLPELCFVGRTDRELSLVCETEQVPERVHRREDGWRAFRVAGQLEFSLVGILAELSGILAEAGVGIFAISTYDTDYILVKEQHLPAALSALEARGILCL